MCVVNKGGVSQTSLSRRILSTHRKHWQDGRVPTWFRLRHFVMVCFLTSSHVAVRPVRVYIKHFEIKAFDQQKAHVTETSYHCLRLRSLISAGIRSCFGRGPFPVRRELARGISVLWSNPPPPPNPTPLHRRIHWDPPIATTFKFMVVVCAALSVGKCI